MRIPTYLLVGTAFAAIASPSFAQTVQEDVAQAANQPEDTQGNDEIIVTAQKRASRVQDVPFSINAQTEEDIQRANATTLEDISRNVAGLTVQNLGPGQSQVSVRGVSAGQIVRDQPGVKEQVGVYLDESVISLSLFTPDLDLFDLNRVETLRGPQGTLFGSGSVGGTIRYITNQPTLGVTEGLVEGNVNTVHEGGTGGHVKGMINMPFGDTVAVRAVAYMTKFPGFIDALGPAIGKDVNDGTRKGYRLSALFEPLPGFKITPRIVYQNVEADGFNREEFFSIYANPLTTTRPPYTFNDREQFLLLREKFEDETTIADLTASLALGPVEFTSISSYIKREILVSRDASALTGSISDDIGLPDAAVLLPSNLVDTTDLKQLTQEFRLSSTGVGPLQWVTGVFFTDIDRDYTQTLPTPGYSGFLGGPAAEAPFDPESPYNSVLPYDIKQKAVFGEASYDFGQFKLTAGGRYYDFKEERRFTSGGVFAAPTDRVDESKSSGFSPRVIATYEPNRNFSLNLQAAKGFRLGGVNDPLNVPICDPGDAELFGGYQAYDDETLWNYEAGVKYQMRGITFNAAAFYTDIKNLQVTFDVNSCSSRLVFNVPKAHTKGLEAEIAAQLLPGLELSLAGSLLEAEFDSTVTDATGTLLAGIREGNRLPSVPKFQMAATATYRQRFSSDADWYVSAAYQHVGNRFSQPADQEDNPRVFVYRPTPDPFAVGADFGGIPYDTGTTVDLRLPAYDLFNLSAGLEFGSGLDVVAYVNNLFDESPKLSFDRERGGRARLGYNIGQPRTIGLTVRQAFRSARAPAAVYVAPPPPPPAPPATQTCPDGSVILATDMCPAPPPPPPPPAPMPERG